MAPDETNTAAAAPNAQVQTGVDPGAPAPSARGEISEDEDISIQAHESADAPKKGDYVAYFTTNRAEQTEEVGVGPYRALVAEVDETGMVCVLNVVRGHGLAALNKRVSHRAKMGEKDADRSCWFRHYDPAKTA